MNNTLLRDITLPKDVSLTKSDYIAFLQTAFSLMMQFPVYIAYGEDINSLELAHIIPPVPETVIAIYVGINDAICNKALVAPFLVRHAHKNVFVFDPNDFSGGTSVPPGTIDARTIINGFEPPNATWQPEWTYVMIEDPARTPQSLWHERGYIDMIPAKFEDFTMLSDLEKSRICFFVDPKAFEHPVNSARGYLKEARKRGEEHAHEYTIPKGLEGETDGLAPVILNRGEKLYIATPDFSPCAHAWSNMHPSNENYAVVNENSAVPLDLVVTKPPVNPKYGKGLIPARGSADMTTDWFYRGKQVVRKPLLEGLVKG